MDKILQPKDTDYLNGYEKKMTPIYAVYKTSTSNLGMEADWKWGNGKIYFIVIEIKKKNNRSSNTHIR